jgi:hypothetical protein
MRRTGCWQQGPTMSDVDKFMNWAQEAEAELVHVKNLLWQFVTANQIPAARKDGTDRLLLDIDPALWGKAADAVGYDEQGQ